MEHRVFTLLFELFSNRRYHATELAAIQPTAAEVLENPQNLTYQIALYDPDFPTFSYQEILDCHEEVPQLEALMRWAMVLYNQYPWHRQQTRLVEVGKLRVYQQHWSQSGVITTILGCLMSVADSRRGGFMFGTLRRWSPRQGIRSLGLEFQSFPRSVKLSTTPSGYQQKHGRD